MSKRLAIAGGKPAVDAGSIPVFVDIDRGTYNIDTKRIEEKITENTRAVIPVHLHGLPCDMDSVRKIADKHKLFIVEDTCQAHYSGAIFRAK